MLFTPPAYECSLCPRLCAFHAVNRKAYPSFFNGPVPAFGGLDAKLLVVGLAPGLKGANQTGRPFTGDYAGLVLYSALQKNGLARGDYKERADDGLQLVDCRITNAVRCVPPENKPEPSEIKNCNAFLKAEIAAMPNLRVILSLGLVSHNAVLKALGLKASAAKFTHGMAHKLVIPHSLRDPDKYLSQPPQQVRGDIILINTYHSSRYNINTGRLTQEMFDDVVASAKAHIT